MTANAGTIWRGFAQAHVANSETIHSDLNGPGEPDVPYSNRFLVLRLACRHHHRYNVVINREWLEEIAYVLEG